MRDTVYIYIDVLARCYVVARLYKVQYCICDTDPPCRFHVHMFTIIQFLRARQTFIQYFKVFYHVVANACTHS